MAFKTDFFYRTNVEVVRLINYPDENKIGVVFQERDTLLPKVNKVTYECKISAEELYKYFCKKTFQALTPDN
jgi:hypothetical protein